MKRFFALIFIASLIGGGIFTGLRWKGQRDFVQASTVYEDTANGFTFRYPVTWDVISKDTDLAYRNEKFVVGVQVVGESNTAVGVLVQPRSVHNIPKPDDLLKEITQEFSAQLTDFKVIQSKAKQYDTYVTVDVRYTHKHRNAAYVQQRQRFLVTKDTMYIVSGTALLVNYPQRQRDINHTMDSFTIVE